MFVLTGSAVMTTGITLGVWAGFLYYEWVHYRVHISSSVRGLNSHRRRHFAHHFVNDRTGFGVTSPLWDVVFGTYGKALVGGPGPDSAFPERLTALDRPTETAPSPKSSRTSTGRVELRIRRDGNEVVKDPRRVRTWSATNPALPHQRETPPTNPPPARPSHPGVFFGTLH